MKEWTTEDDAEVLRMLSQGQTRRQIAAHFGVTRNAICGKVHRLKKNGTPMNPNAETTAALEEIESGGGEIFHGPAQEIFDAIIASDEADQSAPGFSAPHNSGERLPSSDAAEVGADTFPTTGYYVLRHGRLYVATSWKWFTERNFTMQGVAFERDVAIELFRTSSYFRSWPERPDASEFKDWPAAV
jgi:hypothetical protein